MPNELERRTITIIHILTNRKLNKFHLFIPSFNSRDM